MGRWPRSFNSPRSPTWWSLSSGVQRGPFPVARHSILTVRANEDKAPVLLQIQFAWTAAKMDEVIGTLEGLGGAPRRRIVVRLWIPPFAAAIPLLSLLNCHLDSLRLKFPNPFFFPLVSFSSLRVFIWRIIMFFNFSTKSFVELKVKNLYVKNDRSRRSLFPRKCRIKQAVEEGQF